MRLSERIYKDVICKIAETFEGGIDEWQCKLLDIKSLANDAETVWKGTEYIPASNGSAEVQEHDI